MTSTQERNLLESLGKINRNLDRIATVLEQNSGRPIVVHPMDSIPPTPNKED